MGDYSPEDLECLGWDLTVGIRFQIFQLMADTPTPLAYLEEPYRTLWEQFDGKLNFFIDTDDFRL